MSHLVRDKTKLLHRVRRIRGQVDAIERAIEDGSDEACTAIMQLIAATRGAMDSLMASVLEGHVRYHMIDPDRHPTSREGKAAQELIDVVKSYLR